MKPIGCYNGSYGQEKIDNIGSQSYVENSNGGSRYVIVPKILLINSEPTLNPLKVSMYDAYEPTAVASNRLWFETTDILYPLELPVYPS